LDSELIEQIRPEILSFLRNHGDMLMEKDFEEIRKEGAFFKFGASVAIKLGLIGSKFPDEYFMNILMSTVLQMQKEDKRVSYPLSSEALIPDSNIPGNKYL
jgi:hypothetical protein